MCFFGRSRSSPPPVAAAVQQATAAPGMDMNAQQDEQRRRLAASNANTQSMVDSAMTTQTASAVGRTVLGG